VATPFPLVLGIVNATPNSFSDGGKFLEPSRAIERALQLHEEGAHLVDVGGESTRPGAAPVPLDEELARVMPVVEALVARGVAVSVDTMKPEVMRAAIDAGCAVVNDVNAFRAPGAIEAVARGKVGVIAMHMQGTPSTMQQSPRYDDVVAEVAVHLLDRAGSAVAAGVAKDRIVIDPGHDLNKNTDHSLEVTRRLGELATLGFPLLASVSNKDFVQETLDLPRAEVTEGTLAVVVLCVLAGARIVRVHDVRAVRRVITMTEAVLGWRPPAVLRHNV